MTDPRGIAEAWHRLNVAVRDLPLAAGVFLLAVLPVTRGYGTELGGLPDRPFDALAVGAAGLQSLPLVYRRRAPLLCLALVSVGFAVDQLAGYHSFAGVGVFIALLSAGSYAERYRKPAAVSFTVFYVALTAGLYRLGSVEPISEFTTFYLLLCFAAAAGIWQRSRRAEEHDSRERIARDIRNAERTRIARDLHDVVTHHVTAMVVQAEAARYLSTDPERVDRSLDTIADTGRRAIADLRQVLDVLNPNGSDAGLVPGALDVRELVEHSRRTGQRIEFTEGVHAVELDDGAALVVYRVVQEALTNALKHAPGARTAVTLVRNAGDVTVEVLTDAPAHPAALSLRGGDGHGLSGLRERVAVLGGVFSAGGQEDGSFAVRATIPAGSGA